MARLSRPVRRRLPDEAVQYVARGMDCDPGWVKNITSISNGVAGGVGKGCVMDLDDAEPRKPPSRLVPPPLGTWSVVELQAYIGDLRQEITRAEAEILRKEAHRSSADAFFRTPKPV
jgi:uncharacterized small protein (DUF1192 family)